MVFQGARTGEKRVSHLSCQICGTCPDTAVIPRLPPLPFRDTQQEVLSMNYLSLVWEQEKCPDNTFRSSQNPHKCVDIGGPDRPAKDYKISMHIFNHIHLFSGAVEWVLHIPVMEFVFMIACTD